MAIGIGLHCWYCNHGPCNETCLEKEDTGFAIARIKMQQRKNTKSKDQLRDEKIKKILNPCNEIYLEDIGSILDKMQQRKNKLRDEKIKKILSEESPEKKTLPPK